jgi:AT hook motif
MSEIEEKNTPEQSTIENLPQEPLKKARGRPRKPIIEISENKENNTEDKKPRGRPRKYPTEEIEETIKKPRGRPKLVEDETPEELKIRRNKQKHDHALRYRTFSNKIIKFLKEGKIVPKNLYWKNKIIEFQEQYNIKAIK